MKTQTIKLKQDNMLCHRCLMNVVKTLSQLDGIEELNIDLETHRIMLKYSSSSISKETIIALVDESIENGKAVLLPRELN